MNEIQDAATLEGPDHANLVDIQPHVPGLVFINAQQVQGFKKVQVALAGSDNAEAGLFVIE